MLKAQWPEAHQGTNGDSVGGLECRSGDNKLYLTRPQASRRLCIEGSMKASAWVQNDLDEVASICRTNYRGNEFALGLRTCLTRE
jgi:hypothetical protein